MSHININFVLNGSFQVRTGKKMRNSNSLTIDAIGCTELALRLRNFTVTVEPIEWANGETSVHIFLDGSTRLFDGECTDRAEIRHGNHLIITGPATRPTPAD